MAGRAYCISNLPTGLVPSSSVACLLSIFVYHQSPKKAAVPSSSKKEPAIVFICKYSQNSANSDQQKQKTCHVPSFLHKSAPPHIKGRRNGTKPSLTDILISLIPVCLRFQSAMTDTLSENWKQKTATSIILNVAVFGYIFMFSFSLKVKHIIRFLLSIRQRGTEITTILPFRTSQRGSSLNDCTFAAERAFISYFHHSSCG